MMQGWVEIGQVRVVEDPEDEWDGWKVVVQERYVPSNLSTKVRWKIVRIDGEVSDDVGDYWIRHCTRAI